MLKVFRFSKKTPLLFSRIPYKYVKIVTENITRSENLSFSINLADFLGVKGFTMLSLVQILYLSSCLAKKCQNILSAHRKAKIKNKIGFSQRLFWKILERRLLT